MIYILHGDDQLASYGRLQALLKNFPGFKKIRLSEKSTSAEIIMALTSQDLLNANELIIFEDLIMSKKIDFKKIDLNFKNKQLIFWEKSKVSLKSLEKITAKKIVEEFKHQPKIFQFLDSVSPRATNTISLLNSLPAPDKAGLMWHLTNRVFLLILANGNFSLEDVSKMIPRPLQAWQWEKITNQAKNFDIKTLKRIFNGLLKIEYIKKSGQSSIGEETLLTTLFIKYLQS